MDTLNLLLDGFGKAVTPENLLYACVGVLLGTTGIGSGLGITIAVLTYRRFMPLRLGLAEPEARA